MPLLEGIPMHFKENRLTPLCKVHDFLFYPIRSQRYLLLLYYTRRLRVLKSALLILVS